MRTALRALPCAPMHRVRAALPRRATGVALAALAVAVLLGGSGCVIATYTEGIPIPAERVGAIRPGETTKADVLAWFGPPAKYTDDSLIEDLLGGGDNEFERIAGAYDPARIPDVLSYEFHAGRMSGVVLLLFNFLSIEVEPDRLVVFFDEEDRVRYFGYYQRDGEAP